MTNTIINLHHEFQPKLKLEPINPVYQDRMYISGFLGFINTTYKKEMVKCDGYKEIWTCAICGNEFNDQLHKPKIICK